ncbi:glycosyltransferase [Sulfitobacter dubius]|uniref:glycosyltransferase n=1 Tax=Sulfitobacter dubius TaxID=218673 RepID=UPI0022AEE4B2|nr:glycosyltransferase [Sulfitobacter dubius]MCZ4368712.1 glycosyltransferase [Sulfitobacter dubius]
MIAAHAACGTKVPPLVLVGSDVPGLVAEEVGDTGRVRALGRVPDCDLRGLYEGASALVFSALHEGFGIPPLEAMRLNVPVICARSGAMPEVLGDAPLWFDPRDERDIARAMRAFARMGEPQHADMIRRGTLRADGYGWEASALALVEVLGDARRGRMRNERVLEVSSISDNQHVDHGGAA